MRKISINDNPKDLRKPVKHFNSLFLKNKINGKRFDIPEINEGRLTSFRFVFD